MPRKIQPVRGKSWSGCRANNAGKIGLVWVMEILDIDRGSAGLHSAGSPR
jgi:hypothetical protein